MECLDVCLGNDGRMTNGARILKCQLSSDGFTFINKFDDPTDEELFIPKADVWLMKYPKFVSTIPFLCLYLTHSGYRRFKKRFGLRKSDVDRRVLIAIHVRHANLEELEAPFRIFSFLTEHFSGTKVSTLECVNESLGLLEEMSPVLKELFKWEFQWLVESYGVKYYGELSDNVKDSEMEDPELKDERFNGHRKMSSYLIFLSTNPRHSKEQFSTMIESQDSLPKLLEVLYSIYWHPAMINDLCLDYLGDHQCSNPGCAKFSLVKCSNCKVARYCNQECQEHDSEHHRVLCSNLKRKRKETVDNQIIRRHFKHTRDKYVSYEYFLSKISSKIFELMGENLCSDTKLMEEYFRVRNLTLSGLTDEYVLDFVKSNKADLN